jgi:hypothetical protein
MKEREEEEEEEKKETKKKVFLLSKQSSFMNVKALIRSSFDLNLYHCHHHNQIQYKIPISLNLSDDSKIIDTYSLWFIQHTSEL